MTRAGIFLFLAFAGSLLADTPTWQRELSPVIPGNFPPPRAYHASYRFGWSRFTAAYSSLTVAKPRRDQIQLSVEGATSGVVRPLYRLDAKNVSLANLSTLLPVRVSQTEVYRSKTIDTRMEFTDRGVTRLRMVTTDNTPAKAKRFEFPRLLDIYTAWLFLRSQRLKTGDAYNLVIYPGTEPFLANVRVLGREKLQVRAGKYNAIKGELKLQAIDDKLQLRPHTKFKRAFIWISDDSDRLVLRVQADIFVGSVWSELDKVVF